MQVFFLYDYNVNKYMHKIIELYQIINLHVSK